MKPRISRIHEDYFLDRINGILVYVVFSCFKPEAVEQVDEEFTVL